jgi:hypothetical protein
MSKPSSKMKKYLAPYAKLIPNSTAFFSQSSEHLVVSMGGFYRISKKLHSSNTLSTKPTFNRRRAYFLSRLKKVNTNVGWKLHISLKPTMENIEKAWQVFGIIVKKYDLKMFKIVKPERISDASGKEITLPLFKNQHITDWRKIIVEIESLFKDNKILANPQTKQSPPLSDKKIIGSQYLHYRNDSNEKNQYIAANAARLFNKPHNPFLKPDPLDKIVLNQHRRIKKSFS